MRTGDEWISTYTAAGLVGCSRTTVYAAVTAGRIEQRPGPRGQPSLRRSSVEAWAAARRERDRALAAARAAREARTMPPDDEHVWLTSSEVARVLGMSRGRVNQLALRESLPSTRVGDRRWFRRDHIEAIASARALRAHRNADGAPPATGIAGRDAVSNVADQAVR